MTIQSFAGLANVTAYGAALAARTLSAVADDSRDLASELPVEGPNADRDDRDVARLHARENRPDAPAAA